LDIEVINALNDYFEEKDKSYYIKSMKKREHRCKCIKFKENYIG